LQAFAQHEQRGDPEIELARELDRGIDRPHTSG
jgi:hypothetical protein